MKRPLSTVLVLVATIFAACTQSGKQLARVAEPINTSGISTIDEQRIDGSTNKKSGLPKEGEVVLSFVVDENFEASDIATVRSSHPVFEKAAIKALERWKFKAKTPVGSQVKVPFDFGLRGKS